MDCSVTDGGRGVRHQGLPCLVLTGVDNATMSIGHGNPCASRRDDAAPTPRAGGAGIDYGALGRSDAGSYDYDDRSTAASSAGAGCSPVAQYAYDARGGAVARDDSPAAANQCVLYLAFPDVEASQYCYGARYYNPGLGRWVSRGKRRSKLA